MIPTIKEYYKSINIPIALLPRKLNRFDRNKDIGLEFCQWIKTGKYVPDGICVEIEGYSAEKLANMSPYLNGDGAFDLLIELRENKEKALRQIADGFKIR